MIVSAEASVTAPESKTSVPPKYFLIRRVAVALATVVIEASGESGARMQARFALEHGRPVFLLESLLEHQWAIPLRDKIVNAGGIALADEWIHPTDLIAIGAAASAPDATGSTA